MSPSLDALVFLEFRSARNGFVRILRSPRRLALWLLTLAAIAGAASLFTVELPDTRNVIVTGEGATIAAGFTLFGLGIAAALGFGDRFDAELLAARLVSHSTIETATILRLSALRFALCTWLKLIVRGAPFALVWLPKGAGTDPALRCYAVAAALLLLACVLRAFTALAPCSTMTTLIAYHAPSPSREPEHSFPPLRTGSRGSQQRLRPPCSRFWQRRLPAPSM